MEFQYVFAGLVAGIVMVYYYSKRVFAFSRNGQDYLSQLAIEPERHNNNPHVTDALNSRDIPRLLEFIKVESRLHTIMLLAAVVNIVGMYLPPEDFLGQWYGWVLIALLTLTNGDVIMMFFGLRKNKLIVSQLCTGYYNIERAETEAKAKDIYALDFMDAVNHALEALEDDIDKAKEAVEKNDKSDADE